MSPPTHNHVFLFLSYVFTCLAQHCDVRYDFYVKLMYGWPLAPVAYRRTHVFLVLESTVHQFYVEIVADITMMN
jgi:hypothetical protein